MLTPDLHFTFSHPLAALQEIIPLLINLGLFIYVFFFFPHNKLTRLFYLFLIPICLWQLTDLMVHLSADENTAFFWYYLLSPLLNFFPSFGLHFTLVFTRQKTLLKSRLFVFLIYFPAFLFMLLSYAGVVSFKIVASSFWGWLAIGNNKPADISNAYWMVLNAIFIMALLIRRLYKTKNESANHYKQALLVTLGFAIPTVIGIITEFLFPYVFKIDPIPLISTTLSAFSICVIIALRKYELLSFSPRHAWNNIIKNMKEGLLIVNNEDEIQFANDHFCHITGYNDKELIGKKAAVLLLDEKERPRIDEKIWDRKHNVSEKYELSIRKKNGDFIWCTVSGTPFYDRMGNVVGSIGLHADITDRKKAELALMESESGLRIFIEESLLCIYLFNPITKKVVFANQGFFNLLGYNQDEIPEIEVYDFINHSRENIEDRIKETVSGRKINAGEREWKRKDGKIINVLVSSVCIKRQGKDIVYIAAQDITESKQLEKSLTQKIRDLNIFIYQVSHDIKGPLSSILGLTNIGLMETEDPVQKNYFEMIAQSTKRLDNTLNALLDIIVITQGKLKYQPINISQEISDIKHNLAYLPNYSKVTFNEIIELKHQFVADKAMLITILQNLLANAINYANLKNEKPFVNFYAQQENGNIKIIVEDNGVGIAKNYQDKIWDMFFRANELSKGTGLGLFIVRNAVERLNGDIQLESESGKGSRFTISIPAYPEYPAT